MFRMVQSIAFLEFCQVTSPCWKGNKKQAFEFISSFLTCKCADVVSVVKGRIGEQAEDTCIELNIHLVYLIPKGGLIFFLFLWVTGTFFKWYEGSLSLRNSLEWVIWLYLSYFLTILGVWFWLDVYASKTHPNSFWGWMPVRVIICCGYRCLNMKWGNYYCISLYGVKVHIGEEIKLPGISL